MTIRDATHADVPRLVEMGCRFIAETTYAQHIQTSPEALSTFALRLIDDESGLLLVAVNGDDQPQGMIGMLIYPHFMSGERVAAECFWWVNPAERGTTGLRLFKRAEAWAIAHHAMRIQTVAPSPDVERIYQRLGYTWIEAAYSRTVA